MSVDVSPDGQLIAFDLLGTIYEMPFEGGEATPLTSGRSWNILPRFGPNGSRITFSSDRSGTHDVWVLDRDNGQLRNVSASDVENVYRPSWSADGRRIYAGVSGDGIPSQLVAFGLEGDAKHWSPGRGP